MTLALVVYYFSLDSLRRGTNIWFDLRVKQALDDSLQLSQVALNVCMREPLETTEHTASDPSSLNDSVLPIEIDRFREEINAYELT